MWTTSNVGCSVLPIQRPRSTCNKWWFRNNGFGIPAIGAKLAEPDKTVVCFVGDGGFQMTNQEMAILEEYNLDIKL